MLLAPYGTRRAESINACKWETGCRAYVETRDLSKEMPELLAELVGAWEKFAKDIGVVPAAD